MFCGRIYWVLLVSRQFSVPKPLSQIQRSTLWLLQGLSPKSSFGGFGITGNNDRLEIADAAAEAVISSNSGARLWTELARIGKGMLAVQRGDAVKARETYRAFTSADTTHISTFIAFDRLLGLLAQTMGEPNTAATHFHDALALCRKAGYRPELAWTCCDYADLLLERSSNEPGRGGSGTAPADAEDRAKGMALLEESLAISTELGMRPLMERVLSRREILGA